MSVEMPKPRVIDPGDVIVKVTGSTICGSDLHLYHGENRVPTYMSLFNDTNSLCRCHPSASKG